MLCHKFLVQCLSWGLILAGAMHFASLLRFHASYGRYVGFSTSVWMVPARLAWFLQELPALLVPLLLFLTSSGPHGTGSYLLLCTFCIHYFQRTFIYSLLTRGQPYPFGIMVTAMFFCSVNGFLQAHYLMHCAAYDQTYPSTTCMVTGLMIFYLGMAINIHSDNILRNLRKPGEIIYRIPRGGLFEYVSAANYFGETVEWLGYAIATWSLPAFSFAFFSICFIGPRAYHHHRFYLEKFKDYPRSRKPLIPFIF
ncbi:3-oxo-5-alpha-steroid 4-dehydrogenase 2b [Chanos chanos]|uniref:3-oxo-5alpha-steroid 4-dehydrogenase (NADP(+)) n=1 Tax=Chanos chanos TaxID=29144 RepID=A0A6J2VC32_CHACN|nr:3-oxo-5-alpha-steroid 4-dehydrogenase 2-like [Chanos chanos]